MLCGSNCLGTEDKTVNQTNLILDLMKHICKKR